MRVRPWIEGLTGCFLKCVSAYGVPIVLMLSMSKRNSFQNLALRCNW